jgi:hypothetical protein
MNRCAVLIPIYKEMLTVDEAFAVLISLKNLAGYQVFWIAPQSLNTDYYEKKFQVGAIKRYPDEYFSGTEGYSRLLVEKNFYRDFKNHEFVLICQTDAIVLRPDLINWLELPYDYIGAPWPGGYSLQLNITEISVVGGINCTAFVGNGGLSLRRVEACLKLIDEYKSMSDEWKRRGHAEDLFFAFMGELSKNFVLPNIMTAARFSHDIQPELLHQLIGGETPLGIHAWAKYNRILCESIIKRSSQAPKNLQNPQSE